MFSRKNKEKEKSGNVSTVTQSSVSKTTQNLTVRTTYEQRSKSVVYSSSDTQKVTGSLLSLPGLGSNSLPPPLAFSRERSRSSSNTAVDARPIPPSSVNLNYQSPYRGSPVYRSFNRPHTPITSYSRPTAVQAPMTRVPALPPTVSSVNTVPSKELVVKKTGKRYDDDNSIPTYKTSSKNRGEALIINNIMFEGKMERNGAKFDDKRLKDLFKQMGFNVSDERDLKQKQLQSTVESFSKRSSLKNCDVLVVIIMSHGTKNDVMGGTEVFGVDEKGVLVDNLLQYFTSDKCKNMADKPKIFIFQCCRGNNEQFIQSDARPPSKPRPFADMLIAYSTLPGFVSHRDPRQGTWYIQTLCEVFSRHAHEYHVEDMLKIVDVELARLGDSYKQTSCYESRGFKRCYLHP